MHRAVAEEPEGREEREEREEPEEREEREVKDEKNRTESTKNTFLHLLLFEIPSGAKLERSGSHLFFK